MGTQIYNTKVEASARGVRLNPTDLVNLARQNSQTKFRVVQLVLLAADFMMVGLAFWAAYHARFSWITAQLFAADGFQDSIFYSQHVFFLIPVFLLIFRFFKLYDSSILFAGHQEYTQIANASTIGLMLLVVASF